MRFTACAMKSKTPKTDVRVGYMTASNGQSFEVVFADFARKLERKVIAQQKVIKKQASKIEEMQNQLIELAE